ncbi:dehydrogenase [Bacillus sp. J14TS2]|uniref:Gfo/Idh/MocA family protein n=1 Tax=Bacillus sp. J14TS2 TaxID=2807188 RepID=UPI001B2B8D69|nr:Gfo/Idh/MocA family oxidoreductase [Bacillus sp. J14TS2]GIN74645.1 dehydrogenase [Bacillus sp. J14TS2]
MKIAVVGIGKLGQRHLDKWKEIADVEVVGIVARNQEKLQVIAEKYDAKPFTSLEELLNQANVDVVDVCTPTATHGEFVKQAAQAKKHVICEKPLALTSKEANAMIQACEENQVHLLVGHTLRFFPEYANAREQVKNGKIGQPGVIRLTRGVPFPSGREWYADEEQSGGLFLDLGSHEFDWLQWTFGDVTRVMAKHIKREQLEYGFVTVRMTDGTIAYVELSWAETQFQATYELAGDKGMLTYDHNATVPVSLDLRASEPSVQLPKSLMHKDPYQRQFEHFKDCITGKAEPIVTAVDAAKAIELAEAAVQSSATGQPVTLVEGGR